MYIYINILYICIYIYVFIRMNHICVSIIDIIHKPGQSVLPAPRLRRCPTCQGQAPMGPMASTRPGDADALVMQRMLTGYGDIVVNNANPYG